MCFHFDWSVKGKSFMSVRQIFIIALWYLYWLTDNPITGMTLFFSLFLVSKVSCYITYPKDVISVLFFTTESWKGIILIVIFSSHLWSMMPHHLKLLMLKLLAFRWRKGNYKLKDILTLLSFTLPWVIPVGGGGTSFWRRWWRWWVFL